MIICWVPGNPQPSNSMTAEETEIKKLQRELARAYRTVAAMLNHLHKHGLIEDFPNHQNRMIAAAIRWRDEGSLAGADYFDGKPKNLPDEVIAKTGVAVPNKKWSEDAPRV